jgi:tRNA (adenine-N(1)-)-methyltransferase non-catalytic subunit
LDPIQVLTRLRPFLKGSVPVVIYAQFKESLYDAYAFIRASNEYVDCQLSESWMREYQIPSSKGGMHPEMMTSGRGGYILSAITAIIPNEEIIPMHSKKQKKA